MMSWMRIFSARLYRVTKPYLNSLFVRLHVVIPAGGVFSLLLSPISQVNVATKAALWSSSQTLWNPKFRLRNEPRPPSNASCLLQRTAPLVRHI